MWHGLVLDMILIQRVVCFLSASLISQPKPLDFLFITFLKELRALLFCFKLSYPHLNWTTNNSSPLQVVRNKLKLKEHIQTCNGIFLNGIFFNTMKYLECVRFTTFNNEVECRLITTARFGPRLVWPRFMSKFTFGLSQSEESIRDCLDFPS